MVKLRKSFRLEKEVVDKLTGLSVVLSEVKGVKFNQTDTLEYIVNWFADYMKDDEDFQD